MVGLQARLDAEIRYREALFQDKLAENEQGWLQRSQTIADHERLSLGSILRETEQQTEWEAHVLQGQLQSNFTRPIRKVSPADNFARPIVSWALILHLLEKHVCQWLTIAVMTFQPCNTMQDSMKDPMVLSNGCNVASEMSWTATVLGDDKELVWL